MKKVVVIAGGTGGLGKAVAKQLASEYQVVILAPNLATVQMVAKELNCDGYACDIRDADQIAKTITVITKKHKRIDCLVNSAGHWIEGQLDDNDPQDIEQAVAVNLLGPILLIQAVIRPMKEQRSGLIINIVSQGGFYAKAKRSVYTATKFGLDGFTKCLMAELASFGIAVTGLYPGKMKTQMFEKLGITKDMSDGLDPEWVAKTIAFILSFDEPIVFPEVGIKHINN